MTKERTNGKGKENNKENLTKERKIKNKKIKEK